MLSGQNTNTLKGVTELKVAVCFHLASLLVDTEHAKTKRWIFVCLTKFSHIRKCGKLSNLKGEYILNVEWQCF